MATTQSTHHMTVEEFLAWAQAQPGRYELHDGRVVAMSPERVAHVDMKGRVYRALADAIGRAASNCHALPDGATVRISETSCFEPDAMVYCGAVAPRDDIEIANPVIVVEVLSPSTEHIDVARKLAGYFAVPSVMHYLIVDPDKPPVIHHQRRGDGSILTRLVPAGPILLSPPGLTVETETLFPTAQT